MTDEIPTAALTDHRPTEFGADFYNRCSTIESVVAAEQQQANEYPRRWLENISEAAQTAQSVEELRGLLAETIEVLLECLPYGTLKLDF